ncbi:MAG: DUF1579 domain-containing protein [Planctomycetes bacterium]|nr:DUF1579 domain-containing protein [Planctomycetota bacterium]
MRKLLSVCGWMVLVLAPLMVRADEPKLPEPKFPAPEKQHQWLNQFVGQWESESEATMGPGQPPMRCKGQMNARMLGGFWMVADVKTETKGVGMDLAAVLTLGYDTKKQKYVGTWIDSMQNIMWNYEGTVDASGKKIVLEAEGPNFMLEGKLTKFRDSYEFKSPDLVAVTSSMLGADGKWMTFMTGEARRKKGS